MDSDNRERRELERCFELICQRDFPSRALASAMFQSMLYSWIMRWEGQAQAQKPYQQTVDRAIALMFENQARPLNVRDIADEVGISPRWFRKIFAEATGCTPKQYYDKIRLNAAVEMLRMGGVSIGQMAEQLGFSSLFHFSKAFKARFGQPPSQFQPLDLETLKL